jgi:hypothetical protein
LRKYLTNFNSRPPSWENSAYANLCMNTFRDVDGRVNANPTCSISQSISYNVTTLRFGRKCLQKNYRYVATCIHSSIMCSSLLPIVCDCVFDSKRIFAL